MTLPEGFRFADPFWLYLLYFLPAAFLAAFFISRAKHATLNLGNPKLVSYSSTIFSAQWIPAFLRLLVLVLCLIAAARPQEGKKRIEEKRPLTDLFVALDVSGSMVTNDLKPNRITVAKQLLAQFLDKVQDVRVGLTIFARISFTQCPLTTDLGIVKQLLANVEPAPHSIKLDGTAIGDGLVACLSRLQAGSGKDGEKKENLGPSFLSKLLKEDKSQEEVPADSQAIILLTDGSNNAGAVDPLTAARIAISRGIKIYAVGMGAKERVPALAEYSDGHIGPFVDPRTGQLAMSDPVDMGLLREVARITGGKAYAATDNKTFQSVLDDIARLEKKNVTVTSHWEYNELSAYFLLAAFILLALDIILETTVLRTLP